MAIQDFFEPPKAPLDKKVRMALLIQMLQEPLDEPDEDDAIVGRQDEIVEVLTRPHFTPSGG